MLGTPIFRPFRALSSRTPLPNRSTLAGSLKKLAEKKILRPCNANRHVCSLRLFAHPMDKPQTFPPSGTEVRACILVFPSPWLLARAQDFDEMPLPCWGESKAAAKKSLPSSSVSTKRVRLAVVRRERPLRAEARSAGIESLRGRSAPRPLLPGRGESEAFGACVFKLDRRRLFRVGEPELQPNLRRLPWTREIIVVLK